MSMMSEIKSQIGGNDTENVENHGHIEVICLLLRELLDGLVTSMEVIAVKEGDIKARNGNIAESQAGEVLHRGIQCNRNVLGEEELDGALNSGGHCHHHFRTKNPENIIAEQTTLLINRKRKTYEEDEAVGQIADRDGADGLRMRIRGKESVQ